MKFVMGPIGKTNKWSQPKAVISHHELRLDGSLYATLRKPKPKSD